MAEAFFSIRKKIQTEYEKQKELEGSKKESNSQIEDNSRSIQQLWKSTSAKNTILIAKVSHTFHPNIVRYWVTYDITLLPDYYYTVNSNLTSFVPVGLNPSVGYCYWSHRYAQSDGIFGSLTYPYIIHNSWELKGKITKRFEVPNIDMTKYALMVSSNLTVPERAISTRQEKFYLTRPSHPGDPNYEYWVYGKMGLTYPIPSVINNYVLTAEIDLNLGYYAVPIAGDYILTLYVYATEL